MVGIIQYHYTGKWFEFLLHNIIGRMNYNFQDSRLTSYASGLIVRLDGAAMLVGTVAAIMLSYLYSNQNHLKI